MDHGNKKTEDKLVDESHSAKNPGKPSCRCGHTLSRRPRVRLAGVSPVPDDLVWVHEKRCPSGHWVVTRSPFPVNALGRRPDASTG